MTHSIILASGSETRAGLLHKAGVTFSAVSPRLDEESIRHAATAEGARPAEVARILAEAKAAKVGLRHPQHLVIGCDQILALDGKLFSKPRDRQQARSQLAELSGRRHDLFSAVVVREGGRIVWHALGEAGMTMRRLSQGYIDDYVDRNWDDLRHTVGCYRIEAEGIRLFEKIEGDHFTILGLPMLELIGYLADRGLVPS